LLIAASFAVLSLPQSSRAQKQYPQGQAVADDGSTEGEAVESA
jgi:hypothetical protein